MNEPHLSFEDAADATPAQVVELSEDDLTKESHNVLRISLKPIK